MAENSKIEWCDHTVNLWHGCTKVHAGCDNCYAESLSNRWGRDIWGNNKPRLGIKSAFKDLDRYQLQAERSGKILRIFIGSMMDIFEKPMPLSNFKFITTGALRDELFFYINEDRFNRLLLLLLTKRASNINKMWPYRSPGNVMFGTSVSDMRTFQTLVPQLLGVNGKRFLSVEPQLEMIDNIDLKLQR